MSPLITTIILLLLGIALIWRYASSRYTLPCPRWLGFFLDNPLAGREAGRQLSKAGLQPGMAALDAGCGTGRLTLPIARLVGPQGKVVAIDIQQKMLDTVSARAKVLGLENVSCRKTPLGEGVFQDKNIFDRAFLTTVLGEIPKQAQAPALQEIYAALKPGGVLSVAEIMLDPHYQSPARVRQLAEQAGFQFERQFGNRLSFIAHFTKPE